MFEEALPSGEVTIEEAAEMLAKSEEFLNTLSSAEIYVKLLRGAFLSNAMKKRGDRSEHYGASAMDQIIKEAELTFGKKISKTVAYEEKAAYESIMVNYDGNLRELFRFIRRCEDDGYRVYWSTIRSNFTEHIDPHRLYGSAEGADEVAAKQIERLGRQVERSLSHRTGEGAAIAGLETLLSTRDRLSEYDMAEAYNNREYEDWLRHQPCFLTGAINEPGTGREKVVDVAHIWSGVMGSKETILVAIPAHRRIHAKMHQGMQSFSDEYAHYFGEEHINWYRIAFNYLHKYITGSFFDLHLNEPALDNAQLRRESE